ncbi:MAG TPA: cysteine-rich KTR domain-containing protein [Candidatus Limivicinus faecipullorum]|nr:cysteine-rich KTR domain-containing protein [Candidatus Limivicinus faecipullorum]
MEHKQSWLLCPLCRGKTRLRLREDTVIINLPLFCPKCRRETLVDVRHLKVNRRGRPNI